MPEPDQKLDTTHANHDPSTAFSARFLCTVHSSVQKKRTAIDEEGGPMEEAQTPPQRSRRPGGLHSCRMLFGKSPKSSRRHALSGYLVLSFFDRPQGYARRQSLQLNKALTGMPVG